ncbi:MAG: hypothetical protein ABH856_02070 [Patescibacteria group bacterium]
MSPETPGKPEEGVESKESAEKPVSTPDALLSLAAEINVPLEVKDEDRDKIKSAFGGKEINQETVASLTYDELMEAEEKESGTLAVLFGKHMSDVEKGYEGMGLKESYKEGDKVLVNFQGNEKAYWEVGAGDIMPETVREVRICDASGSCRTGKRMGLKGGFHDAQGYIPVFDNYTIEVAKVMTKEELAVERERLEKEEKEFYDKYYSSVGLDPAKMTGREKRQVYNESLKFKSAVEARESWKNDMGDALTHFGITREAEPAFWAVIRNESGFNPYAKNSKSTATGLGQHLAGTWEGLHGKYRGERDKNGNLFMGQYSSVMDTFRDIDGNMEGAGVRAQIFATVAHAVEASKTINSSLRSGGVPKAYWLNLDSPNEFKTELGVRKLYLSHHQGGGGYAKCMKYWYKNNLPMMSGVDSSFPGHTNGGIAYSRKVALTAMSYMA